MPIFDFSVPAMPSKEDLANQLKDLLQDTVQFKFLVHGAHWNVTGKDFQQFHALFEAIYTDADEAIDPLAENIRKLNVSAPIQLSDYLESDEDSEAPTLSTDPVQLAQAVYAANEDVLACVVKAIILATQLNEQGIVNFLADRQDMHSKWQWQLRAIVGDGFADTEQVDASDISLDTPDDDMVSKAWATISQVWDSVLEKYSPDQERDENGRFASGGGSSTGQGSARGSEHLTTAHTMMQENQVSLEQAIKLDYYHEDATDAVVEQGAKIVDSVASRYFGGDSKLAYKALTNPNFGSDLKTSAKQYNQAMQNANNADIYHDDEKEMMHHLDVADNVAQSLANAYFAGDSKLAQNAILTVK